ncbi:MAG: SPASM domain-containing protein [Nitrospirae bacterium]|nr:SPASM domain-containing protein [Nitrospirota bacterium]
MSPDNLIDPFIVYWDINSSRHSDDVIFNICDELIKRKIFVLNLRDLSNPVSATVCGILDKLAGSNIKIRLTVNHDSLEKPMIRNLLERRISLFTETDSVEKFLSVPGNIIGNVSFSLNKKNFHEIPAVISFCIKNRIKELEFPIQRAEEGEIFYPAHSEVDQLAHALKEIPLELLKLTVHDPFLWKVFFTREHLEGMGCNGANTMIYIADNLDVTPCPLLPVTLGNLCSEALKEIFSSVKRRQIRKELIAPPYECRECAIVDNCKGGCRGRAYILLETFDRKDPACCFYC